MKTSNSLRSTIWILWAAFALLFLAGCGGSSSSPESVPKTAVVIGKVAATSAAKTADGAALLAAGDPIDVFVESEPDIKATVGTDGTFTLRGLPEGSFTLVFTQGGATVGKLTFGAVAANQQITISVSLANGEIVLLDEDRRGIGHAGVELEGPVQSVLVLAPAGDSRFVIANRFVIARPGVTAIREGATRKTVEDVTAGRQVHVKGTAIEGSVDVLAYEIILQSPAAAASPGAPENRITICHVPPGKPDKPVTIVIGESAWSAHESHGDKPGACPG